VCRLLDGAFVIQTSATMRILVATEAVDFRCGIDGLARLCRQVLAADPMAGGWFVFINRRRTSVKCLAYDGQGFWLCQKRLSAGHFCHWPAGSAAGQALLGHELQLLLMGGDPGQARAAPLWRPVLTG
jgi:transposase